MASKARTYSKKNPISSFLKKPLAPVLGDAELDAVCSNEYEATESPTTPVKRSSSDVGVPLSPTGKENTPIKRAKSEIPYASSSPLRTPGHKTPTKHSIPKSPKSPPKPKAAVTTTSPSLSANIKTELSRHQKRTFDDMRALKDDLDYVLDGMDSSEPDVRRDSLYRLALECRKGMTTGVLSLLLREDGGADAHRLVDSLLLRWPLFARDVSSRACAAVILHALLLDPANVSHFTRCVGPLKDVVFIGESRERGDSIEKQALALLRACASNAVADDYNYLGERSEANIAAAMAIRALASLSFVKDSLSDAFRQEGIVEGVTELVIRWISKLQPTSPSSPSLSSSSSSSLSSPLQQTYSSPLPPPSSVSIHSLLDIKYSLVILENATFANTDNQSAILRCNGNIVASLLHLIVVATSIIEEVHSRPNDSSSATVDSSSMAAAGINSLDAATDCLVGCIKLLLNLTYNHAGACDQVRFFNTKQVVHNEDNVSENTSNFNADHSESSGPSKKKGNTKLVSQPSSSNSKGEMSDSNNGIAVLLSLLRLKISEREQFDLHQHILGLLINLVEISPLNRSAFGQIDGAIQQIVNLYLERAAHEENLHNTPAISTDQQGAPGNNLGIVGAAYCAMLLGWLSHCCVANTTLICSYLPQDQPFSSLPALLNLFLSFQLQTGILPVDVHKSVTTVIQSLEATCKNL